MTIHFLVEGPSERALLETWGPKLLRGGRVKVHQHQGKGALPSVLSAPPSGKGRGLLDQLPAKLRAFSKTLDSQRDRVVVLVDADNDDVDNLRSEIVTAAKQSSGDIPVTVCVAVEETEAFYLGDLKGLKSAFPDADHARARQYSPDSICGTWELFGSIIGDGGGNKVAWAEAMAPVLTTKREESRSPSFRRLIDGIVAIVPTPKVSAKRRPFRHPTRTTKGPDRRR